MKVIKFLILLLISNQAFAVESASILDRYSVVGVIAGAVNNKDVAVIKDFKNNRSLTVSVGARLGSKGQYRVKKIARRQVVITNGYVELELRYGVQAPEENEEEENIKSYIDIGRTFAGNLIDIYSNADDQNWESRESASEGTDISEYAYKLLKQRKLKNIRPYIVGGSQINLQEEDFDLDSDSDFDEYSDDYDDDEQDEDDYFKTPIKMKTIISIPAYDIDEELD